MMKQIFNYQRILSALVLLGFSSWTFSGSVEEALKTKLNAMRTMTASFSQVVKVKKKEVSRSSGSMALERPGKFRWQTMEPMEQLVIADGNKMWIYDVDLEQVTVKKQAKGLGGTAALFLSGYDNNITNDFAVTQKTEGTKDIFDLKSKSAKENFQRIQLIYEKNILKGMELYDQLGQTTIVKLSNVKVNPAVAAKLFQFKPPKGVDVVKQ